MFTVPGWNVSAKLATQIEKPKPAKEDKKGKKAKKQKQKAEEQVNEGNVGEMWNKVIEGRVEKPVKKVEVKEVVQKEVAPAGEGDQEKRGKKRKRGTRGEGRGPAGGKKAGEETEGAQAGAEAKVEAVEKPKQAKDGEAKRDKKKTKKEHKGEQPVTDAAMPPAAILQSLLPPEPKGLTPLQKSMRQKLAGARFRHLNETLYTKPSADSLALFKEDPSMFEDYHRGFAMQTEGWPENPVDGYVDAILTRGKLRDQSASKEKKQKEQLGGRYRDPTKPEAPEPVTTGALKPLPRNLKGHCTVADLGCGTASLSYRLQPHIKSLNMHIDSYDLSKPSGPSAPFVRIADISALPCADASADVAVFCLALMGTNWLDFIDEAYRILRWRGELWVAEIKSRFGRVEKAKGGSAKGKPPINSIGSLKKGGPKPKKQDNDKDNGELDSADEAELATRIDGAAAKEGTDVSSFVAVLRAHGFVLDAPQETPSAAIDLTNRMFVKMQFVKAAQPTKGKNVTASVNGLKMGMKGKKFTAVEDDDPDDGQNAKVLKPCLYKIR
ncbi:hypothetical protein PMIN06_010819 [Paraphaeosphaeria minitans]